MRPRSASSSSTTNSFPILRFLLLAGTDFACLTFGCTARSGCRLLPTIEHGANLADKNLIREWLVQEVRLRIQNAVPCNKAVGIARHVEHLHSRLAWQQLLCQNAAVDAGHHHIGQQEIKSSSETSGHFQGSLTVLCRQHTESGRFKKGLRKFSQWLGVLHQKNGFRAAQIFSRVGYLLLRGRPTQMSWEINLKGRTVSRRTVHPNIAVALLHHAVHSRKPKPCTFATLLGGKERFEDMRKCCGVHSRSRVGNRQHHVCSHLGTRMVPSVGLVKLHISGL